MQNPQTNDDKLKNDFIKMRSLKMHHNDITIVLKIWRHIGPTGVHLLDFFCSGIQFILLLSPYPCFISLLYLDLYVLGDEALIS